jgi:hypothetical protein
VIAVDRLAADPGPEYDEFVRSNADTLLYASDRYRRLLRTFLKADDRYLVARDGNRIVGVLPAMLRRNERHGAVLNSLPFYGSNGAVVDADGDRRVRQRLLDAFHAIAADEGCAASTIVTSPFERDLAFYDKEAKATFRDERIGQLTALPADGDARAALMQSFHHKTRNMIRKAQKSGLSVRTDGSAADLEFLIRTHTENIEALGGIAKPACFFDLIPQLFRAGDDFRIYVARLGDVPVAALLLFYFNRVVEYFTPVVVAAHRSLQPLSLLIFEAMADAASAGYAWWNWGGTWASQENLYLFKSRWGTRDIPYYYYTRVYRDDILRVPKQTLLDEYPYFFVAPFSQLHA